MLKSNSAKNYIILLIVAVKFSRIQ